MDCRKKPYRELRNVMLSRVYYHRNRVSIEERAALACMLEQSGNVWIEYARNYHNGRRFLRAALRICCTTESLRRYVRTLCFTNRRGPLPADRKGGYRFRNPNQFILRSEAARVFLMLAYPHLTYMRPLVAYMLYVTDPALRYELDGEMVKRHVQQLREALRENRKSQFKYRRNRFLTLEEWIQRSTSYRQTTHDTVECIPFFGHESGDMETAV